MTIITCSGDGCDQELYANHEDTTGYCPEHSGTHAGHGKHYQRKQARSQRETEQQYRVKNNVVNQR